MTIAVTGADGFIGTRLCIDLEGRRRHVRRIVRRQQGPGDDRRVVPDLLNSDSLEAALVGTEAVVHLAARAHVLRETEAEPAKAFERANVDATVHLAGAAVRAGVRRFVFVSSIGVNGNETHDVPFEESNAPAPLESYAVSKLRAELELKKIADSTGLELVIVRPPMVYGPGVKGNFRRLMSLVHAGVPLPLASLKNRRSLIGVENLSDLLILCADSSAAAGELFLAAEAEFHSTPDLMRAIAKAMGRRSRLFRFPPKALRISAQIVGRRDQFDKFCGSLEVSAAKARRALGWNPRLGFDDGIARTAAWFLDPGHAAA